eukprot:TRINITY_DN9775_c0_g1_i1.p1 TRINITY_DN9775_c0_g1~~TRINITY_DN9775_c0_g1_i1.p1  ORF type:complete len:86 (+),score=7.66 TRINITY_DN9775_c0_g1_i1:109-366(+)
MCIRENEVHKNTVLVGRKNVSFFITGNKFTKSQIPFQPCQPYTVLSCVSTLQGFHLLKLRKDAFVYGNCFGEYNDIGFENHKKDS